MNNKFKETVEEIMKGEKGLSFSSMMSFLKSPRHYYEYVVNKTTSKAMNEGKQFHMAILEPEKFKDTYFVLDDTEICEQLIGEGARSPRSKKEYKEWKAEQLSINSDKEEIAIDLYSTFLRMGEVLKRNSATKKIMAGLTAKELRFEYEEDEMKIVGQIDGKGCFNSGVEFTMDLKKVADANWDKLRWKLQRDMHYYTQGGIYGTSQGVFNHFIICIDMNCHVKVVKVTEKTLKQAYEEEFLTGIEKFKQCAEEDRWSESYEFHQGKYTQV